MKNRDGREDFTFYDGPPFANGLPHYGHLLASYIKDTVARYQTMKGKRVMRQFGWDCHGLPAEMNAEKGLGISGRKAVEKYAQLKTRTNDAFLDTTKFPTHVYEYRSIASLQHC